MIKLKQVIGLPSLQYHIDNGLSLYENVYRYSSDSFIQLFNEAREQWRDGNIQLNEADIKLLEDTDIGLYGEYEGQKVPLDLPMLNEIDEDDEYEIASRKLFDMTWDEVRRRNDQGMVQDVHDEVSKDDEEDWDDEDNMYTLRESEEEYPSFEVDKNIKYQDTVITKGYWSYTGKESAGRGVYLNVMNQQMQAFNREDIEIFQKNLPSHFKINEAEYQGKDVSLNKPKRGGSKKFYVYVKNSKGNIVKVSFGGTTGLNVKIDEPGARSSFAARHKCATKKDKTKPGYWSCNIGRYWKSLGGKRNFSGYW